MDFLQESRYVIFDVETTGLDYTRHEIIEIAALKIKDHKPIDTFNFLIRPTVQMDATTQGIHKITLEELQAKGSTHAKVIPDFIRFIDNFTLVGHNILFFDVPFVNMHLLKLKMPTLSNPIIDTLDVAKKALKLQSYSLENLSQYYQISYDGAHRALRDVQINLQVYERLKGEFQKTLF